ncbi:unnamed protein product, partial [Prorocentrum cordatum]
PAGLGPGDSARPEAGAWDAAGAGVRARGGAAPRRHLRGRGAAARRGGPARGGGGAGRCDVPRAGGSGRPAQQRHCVPRLEEQLRERGQPCARTGSAGAARAPPEERALCRAARRRAAARGAAGTGPWRWRRRACAPAALRDLADGAMQRAELGGQLSALQQRLGHEVRPLQEVLFMYDEARDAALQASCMKAHGFVLLTAFLRMQALLMVVGLVRDLVDCVALAARRCSARLMRPVLELLGCMAAALFGLCRVCRGVLSSTGGPATGQQCLVSSREQDAWQGSTVWGPSTAAVRRRTRAHLEALADAAESSPAALAAIGLSSEDVRRHAAELQHIQENCTPMRTPGSRPSWWLAGEGNVGGAAEAEEEVLAAARRAGPAEMLMACAIVLSLPSTVLIVEVATGSFDVACACGVVGVSCAAWAGLFDEGEHMCNASVLAVLSWACTVLGAAACLMDAGSVVASAALLATLRLRAVGARGTRCPLAMESTCSATWSGGSSRPSSAARPSSPTSGAGLWRWRAAPSAPAPRMPCAPPARARRAPRRGAPLGRRWW